MNAVIYEAAARSLFAPAPTTAMGVRAVGGGIIPTDLQPFYAQGVQGFSTFSSTPWYHTTESSRSPRPRPPRPAARVPVDVHVTDPLGQPLTGATVKVLVNQRGHWAAAAGTATEVGDGVYRCTIPAGSTEADRTAITATVDQPAYIGQGFAFVDQRAGGVLPAARPCLSRRVLTLTPRRRGKVTATTSAGKVRVVGRKVRLDLRGVRAGTVRVRIVVRTAKGRVLRQTRTYRTCVGRR